MKRLGQFPMWITLVWMGCHDPGGTPTEDPATSPPVASPTVQVSPTEEVSPAQTDAPTAAPSGEVSPTVAPEVSEEPSVEPSLPPDTTESPTPQPPTPEASTSPDVATEMPATATPDDATATLVPTSTPTPAPTTSPTPDGTPALDGDGDGVLPPEDCDDTNPGVYPNAGEVCDGRDQNCDGAIDEGVTNYGYQDLDGDGYGNPATGDDYCPEEAAVYGGDDCNDDDPNTYPGAYDACGDQTDQDCSGLDANCPDPEYDIDGDGYYQNSDCNDYDSSVYPGASEVCGDGADQDCDGSDVTCPDPDFDGDGYTQPYDCNDYDSSTYPGAYDSCGDQTDQDCDGMDANCPDPIYDYDSDGYDIYADCNDGDSSVHPGAEDYCGDGVDQDCDGSDYNCPDPDNDGDGYLQGYDCNDYDASINPGAGESCNGIDDNCDGYVPTDEFDNDGDGYNICGSGDCDDTNPAIGPAGDLDGDGNSDCFDLDDDEDGLTDIEEVDGSITGFSTDPMDPDTDDDGAPDGVDPAPLTAACKTELLFWDDFIDSPTDDWTVVKGNWQWDEVDLYRNADVAPGNLTWIGARDWTDYYVEARIRPDANSNDGGIIFRSTAVSTTNDGGAHYYLGLYSSSDTVTLGAMTGSWNPLRSASSVINPGTFYTLAAKAVGSSITVSLNGATLFTQSDTRYSKGSIGFRTYNTTMTYDYVLVCE